MSVDFAIERANLLPKSFYLAMDSIVDPPLFFDPIRFLSTKVASFLGPLRLTSALANYDTAVFFYSSTRSDGGVCGTSKPRPPLPKSGFKLRSPWLSS